MFGLALAVRLVNGLLIRLASFTPIAVTLAMYIGLQGCSFLLRDSPGGYINATAVQWITWQIGPIPAVFVVLVVVALVAEYALRNRRVGWQLRAAGSNEDSARRIGLRIDRTFMAGYVAGAVLTVLGAIMLMAQIGVGDPAQGANHTLASITGVVLGGTSLRGGRGTFIGSVLGALLLTEVLNAVSFLGLSQTYQYVFQGALILAAALIYSTVRERAAAQHLAMPAPALMKRQAATSAPAKTRLGALPSNAAAKISAARNFNLNILRHRWARPGVEFVPPCHPVKEVDDGG